MLIELFGVVAVSSMVIMYTLEHRSHLFVLPEAISKILDCLGLPSRTPPISPAVEEADWRY
jgi:hypothetical protein